MPYDFMPAVEGGFEEYHKAREFKERMARQKTTDAAATEQRQYDRFTKRRDEQTDEYSKLGTSLDTLTRGEEVSANPDRFKAMYAAGPGLTPEDTAASKSYGDFQKRLAEKAPKIPGSLEDDRMSFAKGRLQQLMRKQEAGALSPDEDAEMEQLVEFARKSIGMPERPKAAAAAPPAAKAPSLIDRAKSFFGGAAKGATGSPQAGSTGLMRDKKTGKVWRKTNKGYEEVKP